jgi:hypothetical protein
MSVTPASQPSRHQFLADSISSMNDGIADCARTTTASSQELSENKLETCLGLTSKT